MGPKGNRGKRGSSALGRASKKKPDNSFIDDDDDAFDDGAAEDDCHVEPRTKISIYVAASKPGNVKETLFRGQRNTYSLSRTSE